MAEDRVQCRSFVDELREHREKEKGKYASFATFTSDDFEALQRFHVSAHPKPAEYRHLLNKYNLYLTGLVKKFAQDESHGLKYYLDEDNRLRVLDPTVIRRIMILTRDIFRKTVEKSSAAEREELISLYDLYLTSLRKIAANAQERGMECWLLQDTEEEVSSYESFGLRQRTQSRERTKL